MTRATTTGIHSLCLPVMLEREASSADVVITYPSLGRRIVHKKRKTKAQIMLNHFVPLHRFDIFSSASRVRILLITRTIENIPKTTPDQKGRNPGPGDRKVPMPSGVDIKQTKTEIPVQKTPLNTSGEFVIGPPSRTTISTHRVQIPLTSEHRFLQVPWFFSQKIQILHIKVHLQRLQSFYILLDLLKPFQKNH